MEALNLPFRRLQYSDLSSHEHFLITINITKIIYLHILEASLQKVNAVLITTSITLEK